MNVIVEFSSNRLCHLVDDRFDGMIAIDLDHMGQVHVRILKNGVYGYVFAETLNPDEHPEVNESLIQEFWNGNYDDTRLNLRECALMVEALIDVIEECEASDEEAYSEDDYPCEKVM